MTRVSYIACPPTVPSDRARSPLPSSDATASFWHSDPDKFLLRHRTTADLPSSADIVIIGSGITGVSVARYLREDERSQGLSLVLLEAREICSGATGRNGGHCKADIVESSPEVSGFELKNVEAVRLYIEANQVPCEWQTVDGCITYWNEELFAQALKRYSDLREIDPDVADLVRIVRDKEDLQRYQVKPNCVGMIASQNDGQLWPYKYVSFITKKLIKEGMLNVQTNTPVIGLSRTGETQCVHTPRGDIEARQVVFATNGYTSSILPQFQDLITPIRGQMSALHPPPRMQRLSHSYAMVGFGTSDAETDDYLIQRPYRLANGKLTGGHLMYGGGRNYAKYCTVGHMNDDMIDPDVAGYLTTSLPQMLDITCPDVPEQLVASHHWTGIMGKSTDNAPWVGRVPSPAGQGQWEPGLWLCAGYSGHGMSNATLCAKAIAKMILAGEAGYDTTSESLIQQGDLPRTYLITHERFRAVRWVPQNQKVNVRN